jgi:hypothetical protein
MIAQARLLAAGVAGIVLVGTLWAARPDAGPAGAQAPTPATPVAGFEEARLADLQTRVADLSTQVAELGGADDAALAGRLGGQRTGFDALYGAPVAYLGPGQVQYDVPGVGRIAVAFGDGIADRVAIVSPRPPDMPLSEADAADWTPERAREIASAFAPADAPLAPDAAIAPEPVAFTSPALGAATATADAAGCVAAGPRAFTVSAAMPDPDHVAAIELVLGDPVAAPSVAESGGRANRGAGAVANSSLGGVVSVNGLRIEATQARDRADGARPPAEGQTWFAVELSVENGARRPVSFALADFVLVEAAGNVLTAACGGLDPMFPLTEIGRGDVAEGWVSFQVPADFQPQRLVVLAPNARVGFDVG